MPRTSTFILDDCHDPIDGHQTYYYWAVQDVQLASERYSHRQQHCRNRQCYERWAETMISTNSECLAIERQLHEDIHW